MASLQTSGAMAEAPRRVLEIASRDRKNAPDLGRRERRLLHEAVIQLMARRWRAMKAARSPGVAAVVRLVLKPNGNRIR